jgi:hypothetical protein
MAKTVDNFSTIEGFRKTYNELAFDVGEKDGLRDALKLGDSGTLVDAINILEDKKFFLQEYTYIATNNQTVYTGNDNFDVKLLFKKDKIQVFKNERHLVEDIDYIVSSPDGQGNHESIVLQGTYASGQSNAMSAGDRLTLYSYTGAFIGTEIAGAASSFFQKSAENTIYNTNANGVILNGDNSSATTTLESGFTLQLAGKTFAESDIISTVAGKKVQFPTLTDGSATLTSGVLTATTGTFSGTVQAEQLTTTDDLTVGDDAGIGGDLSVTGNATISGNTTLGNAASDTITFTGYANSHLRPETTNTYTLGLTSKKWANVHSTTFTGNLVGNQTGNMTGDVLSSGGQTILDNGTNGTDATIRLSTITNDGSTTVLNVASGALTGTVSSIANHDTGDLTEGSNLYYTSGRADARIAAADINDLNNVNTTGKNSNSVLKYNGSNWVVADINEFVSDTVGNMVTSNTETGLSVTYEDSDNTLDFVLADSTITFSGDVAGSATQTAKGAITVGNMNITANLDQMTDVNYTSSPTAGQILTWDAGNNYWEPANNSTTTDTTSEGTNNKYFTDDRVNSVVQAGNGLSKTFNGGSTVLDGTSTLSVATSNGVKLDGNDVELDYSVITDSDLTGGLPSGSGKAVGHLYFLV